MDLYSTVTKIALGSAVYALHAIFLHEAGIHSLELWMILFKAEVSDVFSRTKETCLRLSTCDFIASLPIVRTSPLQSLQQFCPSP